MNYGSHFGAVVCVNPIFCFYCVVLRRWCEAMACVAGILLVDWVIQYY
jgi:hypothetical protein